MHTLIDVTTGQPPTDPAKTAGFPRGYDHTLDVSERGLAWATTEPQPVAGVFEVPTKADVATQNPDKSWSFKWSLAPVEPARMANMIKAECKRRILDVASAETQQNIAQAGILYSAFRLNGLSEADALAAAGFVQGDMTLCAHFRAWVSAMQTHAGEHVVAANPAFESDDQWPAASDGVIELAGRF